MGILNVAPDSFFETSRHQFDVLNRDIDIVDIGAVSSRPGATSVPLEEEWRRLEPVLSSLPAGHPRISIDTTRSVIVERVFDMIGPFLVNDISSGEDDPEMLGTVGRLGLEYIAMHKRGGPREMDGLCDYSEYASSEYPSGVIPALLDFFSRFEKKALVAGINEWIIDPGLGFAKTPSQCWEILENLEALSIFGRPILVGPGDKRFTRFPPTWAVYGDGNAVAEELALRHGASILRVHIKQ